MRASWTVEGCPEQSRLHSKIRYYQNRTVRIITFKIKTLGLMQAEWYMTKSQLLRKCGHKGHLSPGVWGQFNNTVKPVSKKHTHSMQSASRTKNWK